MRALILLISTLLSMTAARAAFDDGMPFGKISDRDLKQLSAFAQSQGIDVQAEMQRAYEKDTAALGRVFQLSLAFKKLDQNARTYGQIIYSSFLTLSESKDFDYPAVIAAQKPEVQQRIRDFIYYPFTQLPKKEIKEAEKNARKDNPALFPPGYKFGQDDPTFGKN